MTANASKKSAVLVLAALATTGAGLAMASPAEAATSASYSKGILTISGDNAANTIVVSRDAAGRIMVNGAAVKIKGGNATTTNTTRVRVFGSGGADTVTLDEGNGALPPADMFGGADGDTLAGGSKADQLWGEAGDDRIVWAAPGGNDLVEGGEGADTVEVSGDATAESFLVTVNGTRVRVDRTAAAASFLDIGATERLLVRAGAGDDTVNAAGNLAALIQTTVNGEAGQDTLLGSNGADVLNGGDDADFVDGQQGNDAVSLGAGDDSFAWDPGDGNDTVDGGAGTDSSRVNGSNANENMTVSTNGSGARFTRDIAAVVTDLTGVEKLGISTSGGADNFVVNDVSGSGLTDVDLDLAAAIGGGDATADTVTVNGTQATDQIGAANAPGGVAVTGLAAAVTVVDADAGQDVLTIAALAGDDVIDATSVSAGAIQTAINGGLGIDEIRGTRGDDVITGGDDADFVDGQQGNDAVSLGAGDDSFAWDPGDGNDTVDGGAGTDSSRVNGSNVNENMTVSTNGSGARFTRDIAAVVTDLTGVEKLGISASGGADNVTVGDLSGAGLADVEIDLTGPLGSPDTAADTITVLGTAGDDDITVSGTEPGTAAVEGLAATVRLLGADGQQLDGLVVDAAAGDDHVDASGLTNNAVALTVLGSES